MQKKGVDSLPAYTGDYVPCRVRRWINCPAQCPLNQETRDMLPFVFLATVADQKDAGFDPTPSLEAYIEACKNVSPDKRDRYTRQMLSNMGDSASLCAVQNPSILVKN